MRAASVVVSGLLIASFGAMPAAYASHPAPATTTHHSAAKRVKVQGDIDGDGRSDFVGSVKGGFRVHYTSAKVDGSHVQTVTLSDSQTPSSVVTGDFNGDGYADLAVGDPHSNYLRSEQTYDGSFLVYLGSKHGLKTTNPTVFNGKLKTGDVYGQILESLNLNNDKYQDLVEVPDQRGGVKVFFGSANGLTPAPAGALGGSSLSYANESGAFGGFAVGDINGDGRPDLLLGRPFAGKQLGHGEDYSGNEGVISIFYGTASGFATKPVSLHGLKVGTHFRELGFSIAIANVNGDKYADIVAGAPGVDSSNGSVAVIYGAKHGPVARDATVLTAASKGAPKVTNRVGMDSLGTAVGGGDINGDGYADVVVGVPDGHFKKAAGGTALVFYGSQAGLTTDGSQALSLHIDFSKLHNERDSFGTSLVVYNPRGAKFASVAVNAPDYGAKGIDGVVGIYHGTRAGLDLASATALTDVGGDRNYSTGGAIAP